MKPQKKLLTMLSLLLSACASLPAKPSVELGVIDYPRGQVIVNMTGGRSMSRIDSVSKASYGNLAQAIVTGGQRVPLAAYDRAISFKPDAWQTEINYIHSLERYIEGHCQ